VECSHDNKQKTQRRERDCGWWHRLLASIYTGGRWQVFKSTLKTFTKDSTVDRDLCHVGGDGIFRFGSIIVLQLPPRHYRRKSTTPKALDGVLEQCRIQFE